MLVSGMHQKTVASAAVQLGVSFILTGVDDPDLEDIVGGGHQDINKSVSKDWYPYNLQMVSFDSNT